VTRTTPPASAPRDLHVALCGPYPRDEVDARGADGLQRCVVVLAEALAARPGVRVTVVSRGRGASRREQARVRGIDVIWVPDPAPAADYLAGRVMLRRLLGRELAKLRPDIVNAHGEPPYIQAALAHAGPHVVTLHGIFAEQTRAHGRGAPLGHRVAYALMRRWEAGYLPRVRNLIAISDVIANRVAAAAPGARIYRVNNPVDPRFLALPLVSVAEAAVLFVGQLSRRKGVHLLLQAFEKLAARLPRASLRVVGADDQDPAYTAEIRARFAPLVEAGRVMLLGGQPSEVVARELERCAVLCLPSEYEASPLVLLEALAAGKPVVATRVGDAETLVEDGRTGVLVGRGDVEAIAAGLERLLTDRAFRESAGRLAREAVLRRASPQRIADETRIVFEDVLARARSGAQVDAAAGQEDAGVRRVGRAPIVGGSPGARG
jgi:glycosyltransferase involved in cell wall biosynthesis